MHGIVKRFRQVDLSEDVVRVLTLRRRYLGFVALRQLQYGRLCGDPSRITVAAFAVPELHLDALEVEAEAQADVLREGLLVRPEVV